MEQALLINQNEVKKVSKPNIDIIAVDFDGTIVEENYPNVGDLIHKAKEVLLKFHNKGGTIILNTCRHDLDLKKALLFMNLNNIPFDFVNSNDPDMIRKYNSDSRKIGADMYIDNRSPESIQKGYVDWSLIEELII